ncbi:cupredoxin domain-containing protein [Nitrosopumilus sp. b2]|uniref:cupredoxin domain-containing protein n=1 Tax=Nitrosopumilus sp. b2 TaxID=2109908 RepID=UPI0015F47C91|nr:cupredoxin domain-containing protein [Nitrosopumilus sp. b2]KAF6245208.1 hypothetical protein C6989_04575 [Nitrosopumilus sp. b2]
MVSQYIWIGVVIGAFVVGIAGSYTVFNAENTSVAPQNMQQMMQDSTQRQQMRSMMMQDSDMMTEMMQDPQFMQRMGSMCSNPELCQGMFDSMMSNPEMMQRMTEMMGGSMGRHMMGSMMNQQMFDTMNQPLADTQTELPIGSEPQLRTFGIELGEVEFFANTENESGDEDAVYVELHKWNPNVFVVNKGDTVSLKVTNPRGNYHSFSIPEFGVSTSMLDPRGGTETIEFVADKAGTFTFSCEVPYNPDQQWCDPDHAMMTGTIIVLDN